MSRIVLYLHGGSENHGCEAIVRSTKNILKDNDILLLSNHPEMDKKYGLDDIVVIENRGVTFKRFSFPWVIREIKMRLFNDKLAFARDNYKNVVTVKDKEDIYLSIGGDNYCGSLVPVLQYLNEEITNQGAKTVLWGCSIDPSYLDKKENVDDLNRYTKIIAREKITFQSLIDAGIDTEVVYHSDPAFTLESEKWELPSVFSTSKVIGINISPYVQKNGSGNLVYKNYERLIEYILSETEYSIALLPHVVWKESDDLVPITRLYRRFSDSERIVIINDQNCQRLKYCISNCDMFIAARTHASIAAYSTTVPTLVVGYSMKSHGIAKDLFGSEENYVIDASSMNHEYNLVESFKWLSENKESIHEHLKVIMPAYIEDAYAVANEIINL